MRACRDFLRRYSIVFAAVLFAAALLFHRYGGVPGARAQAPAPTVVDPDLAVRTVVAGLTTPTSIAFLGDSDLLVTEKSTGRVRRVINGVIQEPPVLDLAVNSASERGLLSITLHPDFPGKPFVYLYWTESTTGADSNVLAETPLLGNRVDRFLWNGSLLAFERNIVRLRALQPAFTTANGIAETARGNHDGGVITFGPKQLEDDDEDEDNNRGPGSSGGNRGPNRGPGRGGEDGGNRDKLFIIIGDNGRRGQMQNLPFGPLGPGFPDDQFGGPQPDNAHLTGVILRLNDDGTTPEDNPFFRVGARMGGEAGANIQKVFAYGVRNSFGMSFDPFSGELWTQENGDDSFDEINRVEAGFDGGWIQVAGPLSRIAQFKEIETTFGNGQMQQMRWPPANIADSPGQAVSRMFRLPGSRYTDPQFAWKWAVPPGGIGFLGSSRLGRQYRGNLFVGAATPATMGGYLFRFKLSNNRKSLAFDDPRLRDGVADNNAKHDITESESLLFGTNFGVTTDVETGPNGNLFLVQIAPAGAILEIHRR